MNRATPRTKLQFSLRDLACLTFAISLWLAVLHYCGPLGIVLTSPVLGAALLLVGTAYRMRALAALGVLLFLAGPILLGIAFAAFSVLR